jgi:hypothetical protein
MSLWAGPGMSFPTRSRRLARPSFSRSSGSPRGQIPPRDALEVMRISAVVRTSRLGHRASGLAEI